LLIDAAADQQAFVDARRIAGRTRQVPEYENARHAAARAWRAALPQVQGPWLIVGAAIANAAGALVLENVLDRKTFLTLAGPWQQAIGTLVAVGPGAGSAQRSQALAQRVIR